jgi:TetR/AcrR family transcriptional regulator
MSQVAAHGFRAERTRGAILAAAESLFAERGFDATRLEDIAESVGIRRASIVYYFRDKRAVYDAVLADVLQGVREAIERALAKELPPAQRIDAAVSAWIDQVARRPNTARLILREAANASSEVGSAVWEHSRPLADLIRREFFERRDVGEAIVAKIDPIHVASTLAGATVFFVAAMPRLLPDRGLDPTRPDHIAAHKEAILAIVHRLLGTPDS